MGSIEAMQHPSLFRKLERIEAVWIERGSGRALRGKCWIFHTPLGVASTRVFQAFSVKPPAMPVEACRKKAFALSCEESELRITS